MRKAMCKQDVTIYQQKLDRFQTLCNNSQQNVTTSNRVCKRTQNVGFDRFF